MKQYLPRVDEVGFSFDTRQLLLAAHVWFGLWGCGRGIKDAGIFKEKNLARGDVSCPQASKDRVDQIHNNKAKATLPAH